ncbi:hypothetical protein IMAU80009_03019 [Lactiplantibacillus plantarum]|nr:hypothetical protein [Lactiplantibacillus plantarum]
MTTIFETGAPQTIAQVLANKDARAALQAQLVATKAASDHCRSEAQHSRSNQGQPNVESGLYGGRVADHLG